MASRGSILKIFFSLDLWLIDPLLLYSIILNICQKQELLIQLLFSLLNLICCLLGRDSLKYITSTECNLETISQILNRTSYFNILQVTNNKEFQRKSQPKLNLVLSIYQNPLFSHIYSMSKIYSQILNLYVVHFCYVMLVYP